MSDKLQSAREYILSEIENGHFSGGDKLPAARELGKSIGISLPIIQMAFVSLTRDGILTSVARQGTYVRHDWQSRILPGSFQTFRPVWSDIIRHSPIAGFEGVRICDKFNDGVFEIRATMEAQKRQAHYLDLAGLFKEAYPDRSDFFLSPFKAFETIDGKLYGIPLIFSPWVVCYNPELIEKAGGAEPRPGWNWADFIGLIRTLRRMLPGNEVINFSGNPSFWMNIVFRAGGGLLEKNDGGYSVRLDEPASIDGLNKVKEFYQALRLPGPSSASTEERFRAGKLAMAILPREDMAFGMTFACKCVPMPMIPGGRDLVVQATDLLCVRRLANDLDQVREIIRLLLSEEVQDKLGEVRYGIPIRRTSAIRSFTESSPGDAVFYSEMAKVSADYNFGSLTIYNLIHRGLNRIWLEDADAAETASEIAAALRTMIRYRVFE